MRGPRGEVYTTMGTRILMLADGGSVLVTKDETELVKLSVKQAPNGHRIDLPLTSTDCLSLIEFLAVAARPGSGKELVEMPESATESEPDRLVVLLASGLEHVRAKCTREDCTGSCNTCTLFICEVCNGAEATLLPTCPGRRLNAYEQDAIQSGEIVSVADLEPPTGLTCSECHKPQFSTPGGLTCENGHGGAPSDP